MKHHLPPGKNSHIVSIYSILKFITCFVLLLCSQSLFAQQAVTGRVTQADSALAGVTVTVKGTHTATQTDANGNFHINAALNSTLVFSSVGYASQEVPVNNQTVINVELQVTSAEMNEVVVIGYQTVRRKDLTGSTGIVNLTNSNKVIAQSIGESIQGLVPGVTVRNGGAPGQNPTIEIRGVASFTNTSPLYVIDGMLADANSTINTEDIASIQILKDASAAAIYGSRAGNGVIIITTRKGKQGPPKINVSARFGVQQIPTKWNVMSAGQYLQTIQQEYQNSNVQLPTGIAAQVANPTINTDWQNEVYRDGNDEDYNVGISGGSNASNYLISASYYKNQGVLIANDFERASLRINTEAKKGILTVGENMVMSSTDGTNPGGGVNAFYEAPQMLPIIAVQDSSYKSIPSDPAGWGMGTNEVPTYASNYTAVAALDKQTYHFAKIVGNAYADLKFTNWLSYRFNLGAEVSFDYFKEVRDTGIWRYSNQPPNTSVSEDREQFTNFLMEHTLNFNHTFGKHAINGVVGFSRTQQRRDVTGAGRSILQSSNGQLFTTIGSAFGTATASGGTPVFWRQHGYLGRINYTYNDKYLLTLTGRIDQDSRFGPNYKTGYFPSAAVAWRLSKEDFFNVSWINDLKLRASYGKLGIAGALDVLGSWPYLGVLNNYPRAIYGSGQTPIVGEYQAELTNPNLHWETRIEKNAGFDASLFNNRVTLSVDVYNALSKDVIVALPAPIYLGSSGSTVANAGSIKNTGIEFQATYKSRSAPFQWDVSANFTTIKNKVVSVGNQGTDAEGNVRDYLEPTAFLRAQVGYSIGQWYVIKADGIFQSQDEINSYVSKSGVLIQPNAKPGDIKYVDANGDGVINNEDRQYAGSPWPTLQTGAQFNASYKNFNINIQLIGVFGITIYDDIRRILDSYQLTNFRTDIDPWSPTHTSGTDPRLAVDVASDPEVAFNNMAQTTRWLENGSYVRLRNVEIGYNFANSFLKRTGVSNTRIYVSGQNLLTITKYQGLDPDVQGNGILERGFDAGNWPASRIFTAGIQLEF